MKILLTGATGLIGKEIGNALAQSGHELKILTRDPARARCELHYPAEKIKWAGHHSELPEVALEGVEIVINLAGESIASGRWTESRKKTIYESRILGTRAIVNSIIKRIQNNNSSVKQFISASAIGIYGDSLDGNFTEQSPASNDFLSKLCSDWENEANELRSQKIKVVNSRIGIVLARDGGALDKMLPLFSLGLGGAVGSGKQWMSWIHHEDLTRLFLFFINKELDGAFNAVAPKPVTNRTFSQLLAHSLNRGLIFPVPSIVLKIALGNMSTLVIHGQRVSAKKVLDHGFDFKYKELPAALEEICAPLQNGTKELVAEQWVPSNQSTVFPFFCNEKNLETLTPSFLKFKVIGKTTSEIREGTVINYRLSLHGLPMKWKSQIEEWRPGEKFVDRQLTGPYSVWHHTHEFIELGGGTLLRDRVLYKLPFGRIGELVAGLKVKSDVMKIFSYRRKIIADIFHKKIVTK